MTDRTETNGGGAGRGLYFIVGILVAAVIALGYVVFGGDLGLGSREAGVSISITEEGASVEAQGPDGEGGEMSVGGE